MKKCLFLSLVLALILFPSFIPSQVLAQENGWISMNSGTANSLAGIWGGSADDVFAVGENGTILHYGLSTPTATFGLNSGNHNFTLGANSLEAMRFQNTAGTGTLNKLELLVNDKTPAGKVRMGVYSDDNGKPGVRLMDAGEATVVNGWTSISGLDLGVYAGTYYWLVFHPQNSNTFRYQTGFPANSHRWASADYESLPSTFPIVARNTNSSPYVMRATVAFSPVQLLALDDAYAINEDTPLTIQAPGVLANDSGSNLTAIKVANPTHGSVTLNNNGSFTYTPVANYTGSDSFTYKANDSQADSNVATVTITVNAVNDLPIADAKTMTTKQDTALAVTLSGSDVETVELTFNIVDLPQHGSLSAISSIPGVAGTPNTDSADITYTPAAGYSGGDNFTYVVNDGAADSAKATVSITVNPPDNVPPVAVDDTYTTNKNTPLNVPAPGVLANDSDPDGKALSAVKVTDPSHGSLILNADGSFTYTPVANYTGSDSFTYKANDGTADSNVATVTITINPPANTPPVANNQSVATYIDTPVGITLSASDTDGDALTYAIITPPANGSLTGTAPNLTYAPIANYIGSDSFTYKANDGSVDSNIATVSITISSPPAPPPPPPPGGESTGGGGGGGDRQYLTQYINSGQPGVFTSEAFLKTWDGILRLTIPKGTTAKTVEGWGLSYIVLQPIPQAEQKLPPPDNGDIIGLTYKLEPEGATFSTTVNITVLYKDEQSPAGINEKDLVIGYWNTKNEKWEGLEGCVVDIINNQITAPLSHFSTYAVIYIPPEVTPASFNVGSLNISPSEATVGQEITISATVTNNGGSAGRYSLYLKINDVQVGSQEVELDSGLSQTVQFSLKKDSAGEYAADINGKTGQLIVKEPEGKIAESTPDITLLPQPAQIPSPAPVAAVTPALISSPTATSSSPASPEAENPSGVVSKWIVLYVVILTAVIIGSIVLLLRYKPGKSRKN